MGGGPSKGDQNNGALNGKKLTKKSIPAKIGVNDEPLNQQKIRVCSFQVPNVHLQSHEINEIRCMTSGKHMITDFIIGFNRSTQSQYQSILEQLNKGAGNLYYQDPSFPAQLSSLTKDVNSFKIAQNLTWKRPSQFMPSVSGKGITYYVFEKGIEPNDIIQGELGDCYFLSAISCLAEKQGLIERLFETANVSQQGCYCLWICFDGEWTQVILDDFFPCLNNSGPAFSHSHENELWVMLLEKAYAKLYGSYEKIEAGLAGHAIHDLTGAPYKYFVRDLDSEFDEEDIWSLVYENVVKKGYIVTASSEENSRALPNSQPQGDGIVSNHSYSILDAREVVDSEGKQDKIFQIRNPWGNFEWKGDWSDSSYKWTQKTAQELHVESSDDGLFWINTVDFLDKFSQIMVSKVEDGMKYSSIRSTKAQIQDKVTTRVFTMKVFSQMQKCHIGVTQKDKRFFSKNPKAQEYHYSIFRLMVASLNEKTTGIDTFIGSIIDCDRDIAFEIEQPLQPGVYLIYVEADWVTEDIRDFVVWCYGSNPVEFLEIKSFIQGGVGSNSLKAGNIAQSYAALLDDLLEVHSLSEEKERIHNYNDQINRTSGSVCGYVYFLYDNQSNDVHLREEIQMKNAEHLSLCDKSYYVSQGLVRVQVAPGDREIVKYRADQEGRGEYSYNTAVNYILLKQVDHNNIEELTKLALLEPSKVKQREMHGFQMKVFVHTFVYHGGVCFLYVNKTSSKTYVEDLQLEVQNLRGDNRDIDDVIHIEVTPQSTQLLNLLTIDIEEEIAYKPKMTYYLK